MDLYKEILIELLSKEQINITFPDLKQDLSKIVEMKCFKALQKIKTIIEDDSLEDSECFMKIEQVICVLEEIGSDGGSRHDFG
jgi:hypothetical protein